LDFGQRILSAAVHDLEQLDQSLFLARLASATRKNPPADHEVGTNRESPDLH